LSDISPARSTIISGIGYYFGADCFRIDESHRDLSAMIETHDETHRVQRTAVSNRYEARLFVMCNSPSGEVTLGSLQRAELVRKTIFPRTRKYIGGFSV